MKPETEIQALKDRLAALEEAAAAKPKRQRNHPVLELASRRSLIARLGELRTSWQREGSMLAVAAKTADDAALEAIKKAQQSSDAAYRAHLEAEQEFVRVERTITSELKAGGSDLLADFRDEIATAIQAAEATVDRNTPREDRWLLDRAISQRVRLLQVFAESVQVWFELPHDDAALRAHFDQAIAAVPSVAQCAHDITNKAPEPFRPRYTETPNPAITPEIRARIDEMWSVGQRPSHRIYGA